ncbi:MAG: hypothetical protein R2857_01310 [Vampirovibrionales bacterium]
MNAPISMNTWASDPYANYGYQYPQQSSYTASYPASSYGTSSSYGYPQQQQPQGYASGYTAAPAYPQSYAQQSYPQAYQQAYPQPAYQPPVAAPPQSQAGPDMAALAQLLQGAGGGLSPQGGFDAVPPPTADTFSSPVSAPPESAETFQPMDSYSQDFAQPMADQPAKKGGFLRTAAKWVVRALALLGVANLLGFGKSGPAQDSEVDGYGSVVLKDGLKYAHGEQPVFVGQQRVVQSDGTEKNQLTGFYRIDPTDSTPYLIDPADVMIDHEPDTDLAELDDSGMALISLEDLESMKAEVRAWHPHYRAEK